MNNKVLLVLFDGATPDSLKKCGHPFFDKLISESAYSFNAQTVMPSDTLPCHFSLFTSVDTDIHGFKTNSFDSKEKWARTMFEQLEYAGKTSAVFYNWVELQYLWLYPGSIIQSVFYSAYFTDMRTANTLTMKAAKKCIDEYAPDFVFLYIGEPDEIGHHHGWMSDEYLESVNYSMSLLEEVCKTLPEEYALILTADHGGHGHDHGSEDPNDMTIPLIIRGDGFAPGRILENASIKDIVPTAADIIGAEKYAGWQGRSHFIKNGE